MCLFACLGFLYFCIDWQAKQLLQVTCTSEDLKCWGAWDMACRQTVKDITHYWLPGGEKHTRKRLWQMIYLDDEIVLLSIRQTLQQFQSISERQDGAHMGFVECVDSILKFTDLTSFFRGHPCSSFIAQRLFKIQFYVFATICLHLCTVPLTIQAAAFCLQRYSFTAEPHGETCPWKDCPSSCNTISTEFLC